ncbi:MAG: hypothetical protein IJA60_02860 [Clostridia bacterium]|nr:hypothetical protein [Clostridia bacterium]
MKKRLFALALAVLMLLSLSLVGCSKNNVEDGTVNGGESTNAPVVEKTPAEYLSAAIDGAFAEESKTVSFLESMEKGGRTTLSVGNIEPLLALAGVDTATIPPISDIAFDIYVGNNGSYAAEAISAKIGDTLCDITAFIDPEKIVLSSAQVPATYSITFEELFSLAEVELPFTASDLMKYDDAFFEALVTKYCDMAEELLLKNAALGKKDDGDNVIVTLELTPESLAAIVTPIVEAISADEELIGFVTLAYGEESAAAVKDLANQTGTIAEDLTEAGFSLKADITLDKTTSAFKVMDMVIVAEDDPLNVTVENGDDFKIVLAADDQAINITVTDTGATLSVTEGATELVNATATFADGNAVVNCISEGTELFNLTGSYEVTDTTFTFVFDEIKAEDVVIDLSTYEIAIAVDLNATAPTMPETATSILDLTEEELQNILFQFIANSGIMAYLQ